MDTLLPMNELTPEHQTMLATWQQHTYAEFVLKDADAALATMTENPYVLAIPSGTGGSGRAGVREFYAKEFLPSIPPDFELTSLSQTFGRDRIVEEFVIRFPHTLKMNWMLPGLLARVEKSSWASWASSSSKPAKSPTSGSIGIRRQCSRSCGSWIIRWRRPALAVRRNCCNSGDFSFQSERIIASKWKPDTCKLECDTVQENARGAYADSTG